MRFIKRHFRKIVVSVCSLSILLMALVVPASAKDFNLKGELTLPKPYVKPVGTVSDGFGDIVYNRDRIAFFASQQGGVWSLLPVVVGKQTIDSVLQRLNQYTENTRIVYRASSLINDSSWEFLLQYPEGDNLSSVRLIARWMTGDLPYLEELRDWCPEYRIWFKYVDERGQDVDVAVPIGTLDVRSPWLMSLVQVQGRDDVTYFYPCIDISTLNSTSLPDNVVGIRIYYEAYYYNIDDVIANGYDNATFYDTGFTQPAVYSNNSYIFGDLLTDIRNSAYNSGFTAGDRAGYYRGRAEGVAAGERYNAVDGILTLAKAPGIFITEMLNFEVFGINLALTVKAIFTIVLISAVLVIFLRFLL